jgi:hypothetical protein
MNFSLKGTLVTLATVVPKTTCLTTAGYSSCCAGYAVPLNNLINMAVLTICLGVLRLSVSMPILTQQVGL